MWLKLECKNILYARATLIDCHNYVGAFNLFLLLVITFPGVITLCGGKCFCVNAHVQVFGHIYYILNKYV